MSGAIISVMDFLGKRFGRVIVSVIKRILSKSPFPKELTPIPQISLDNFIGRKDELEKIHQYLESKSDVFLINGMGGVGKTTLMEVYLKKYYKHYRHIMRIDHTGKDLIEDFITNRDLRIRLNIASDLTDKEDVFSEIIYKLASIEALPNLMLLDNITNAEEKIIRERLNMSNWRIISTSHNMLNPEKSNYP